MDAAPDSAAAAVLPVAPPVFTHRQVLRVLSGVLLCTLLAALDQTAVVPAVPTMAAELNGFGHLAWIVSAYLLTSTAATPIFGKLSDTYGRRIMLLPALVLFATASVLCAMSDSLWQLIAARALQGIGGGGMVAMAQASIADVVAPRERGRYQVYMTAVWGVASIAGPVVGGWLTGQFSWRWIFWINLPICLLAMLLSDRALRLLVPQHRRTRIDYAGAALLTGAIAAFLLVLSSGGSTYPWISAPVIGAALAAVVLFVLLALRERMAADPLLPPRLFANHTLVSGVCIGFLAATGTLGGTFLLPMFLQLGRGVGAAASGMQIVPFLLASVFGAYMFGFASRRFGRAKGAVVMALSISTTGFTLLAFAGRDTPDVVVTLMMVLAGGGLGTCMPGSLVIVQNAAGRTDIGAATGAALLLRSLGGAFGSTIAGAALAVGFAARLATTGGMPIDLGAMRQGSAAFAGLDAAGRVAAQAALARGFHLAFAACAVAAGAGLAIALLMPDTPLRSSRT
jgi:EmrB/QacA subfamily drug resistance transporter